MRSPSTVVRECDPERRGTLQDTHLMYTIQIARVAQISDKVVLKSRPIGAVEKPRPCAMACFQVRALGEGLKLGNLHPQSVQTRHQPGRGYRLEQGRLPAVRMTRDLQGDGLVISPKGV